MMMRHLLQNHNALGLDKLVLYQCSDLFVAGVMQVSGEGGGNVGCLMFVCLGMVAGLHNYQST